MKGDLGDIPANLIPHFLAIPARHIFEADFGSVVDSPSDQCPCNHCEDDEDRNEDEVAVGVVHIIIIPPPCPLVKEILPPSKSRARRIMIMVIIINLAAAHQYTPMHHHAVASHDDLSGEVEDHGIDQFGGQGRG